jgi:hypothetical protein
VIVSKFNDIFKLLDDIEKEYKEAENYITQLLTEKKQKDTQISELTKALELACEDVTWWENDKKVIKPVKEVVSHYITQAKEKTDG